MPYVSGVFIGYWRSCGRRRTERECCLPVAVRRFCSPIVRCTKPGSNPRPHPRARTPRARLQTYFLRRPVQCHVKTTFDFVRFINFFHFHFGRATNGEETEICTMYASQGRRRSAILPIHNIVVLHYYCCCHFMLSGHAFSRRRFPRPLRQ